MGSRRSRGDRLGGLGKQGFDGNVKSFGNPSQLIDRERSVARHTTRECLLSHADLMGEGCLSALASGHLGADIRRNSVRE